MERNKTVPILVAAGKNLWNKIKQRLNPKGFNISSRR
jgi:hypothetical protein